MLGKAGPRFGTVDAEVSGIGKRVLAGLVHAATATPRLGTLKTLPPVLISPGLLGNQKKLLRVAHITSKIRQGKVRLGVPGGIPRGCRRRHMRRFELLLGPAANSSFLLLIYMVPTEIKIRLVGVEVQRPLILALGRRRRGRGVGTDHCLGGVGAL